MREIPAEVLRVGRRQIRFKTPLAGRRRGPDVTGGYRDLARIELIRSHQDKRDASAVPYRGAFSRWSDLASVRRARERRLEQTEHLPLYFSPELVPVSRHPEVVRRGPVVVHDLLVRRLYQYLTFTVELETLAVLPVTSRISRGRLGLDIPCAMQRDAFKITTDEAWHAQFSYDLIDQVEQRTGVTYAPSEPSFLGRLDAVHSAAAPRVHGLDDVMFAVVSETLISSLLSQLPTDARLPAAVRETVTDHALDEGRHHAYFKTLLGLIWPRLEPRDHAAMGPLLPALMRAFLEPDLGSLEADLRAVGLSRDEAHGVVEESLPAHDVDRDIATGAASAVRYFREVGALDEPATADAFRAARLIA